MFARIIQKYHALILPLLVMGLMSTLGIFWLLSGHASTSNPRADIDRNGKVNSDDVQALMGKYGSADPSSDLNGDAVVNLIDLSILLSNFGTAVGSPTGSLPGVQAARSADFLDTIGVNIHVNYFDTAYNNWPAVKQKLQELKIKHVRGGSYWNFAEADRRQDELHAMGIRVNMILSADRYNEQVAYLKSKPRGFVTSVESLNEPDCFLHKTNPDWVNETRRLQKAAYEAMKATPELRDIPVLGTSYCRADTHAKVGDLSQWYDQTNTHPYPGGLAPEDRIATTMQNIRQQYGTKPVTATETGYHNAVNFLEGGGVSEQASATYLPRLYLSYFQAGIKRTYVYELVEPRPATWVTHTFDRDNHWGLYSSGFAAKPAADSLRRLTTILQDAGTAFAPGKLDYAVSGDTTNLQQQLLQKADGRFYLVLWRKDAVWNVGTKTAIGAPSRPLTITVQPGAQQIAHYHLNQSDGAIAIGSGNSYSLQLGAEVQILEFVP